MVVTEADLCPVCGAADFGGGGGVICAALAELAQAAITPAVEFADGINGASVAVLGTDLCPVCDAADFGGGGGSICVA